MAENAAALSLEERLERGELLVFSPCPFPLPGADDRAFLYEQQLKGKKNISFHPAERTVKGFVPSAAQHGERLARVLGDFADAAQNWLAQALPRYAASWRPDLVTYHPEEEATRRLRVSARNDLLHIDAFPSRPARGWRILRLYVNIHPTDARVWATSETFDALLEKYGKVAGLPTSLRSGWAWRLGQGLLNVFQPGSVERTPYDQFMLRFHHFLKSHDPFQDKAPRRLWHFPPNSAWLAFTDGLSHAELRGRFALGHSFFISPHSLALPERSPAALLERACGQQFLPRVA